MIKYGVILAAGDGGRLAPFTHQMPKPLVPVLGKPLIDYTLESFAQAEIRDVVVVAGYRDEMLRQYLGDGSRLGLRVQFVHKPAFAAGNALSLYAGMETLADGTFLLAMADHLLSPALLKKACKSEGPYCTLCVDYLPHPLLVEGATRVWVGENNRILRIEKGLQKWNALDTGVFLLTREVFQGIEEVLRKRGDCRMSEAVAWLIENGRRMKACDVTGTFWFDVDSPCDLEWAEKLLGEI